MQGDEGTTHPGGQCDPVALLGNWLLTDTGREDRIGLRLSLGGLRVITRCGTFMGEWRSNSDGQFLGEAWGGIDCETEHVDGFSPSWLRAATGFRVQGDERLLVDANGGVVARLVPGWKPKPGQDAAEIEELRKLMADPKNIDNFRQSSVDITPLPPNVDSRHSRPACRPVGAGGHVKDAERAEVPATL